MLQVWTGEVVGRRRGAGGGGHWASGPRDSADGAAQRQGRDIYGISRLPQIQLILPFKIWCIKGSSEIPSISLRQGRVEDGRPDAGVPQQGVHCDQGRQESCDGGGQHQRERDPGRNSKGISELHLPQLILPSKYKVVQRSHYYPWFQAWRGYHRCEMAWSVTSVPGELTSDTQLSLLLLLYLPRRGLIEVSALWET